jgi:N-methylhydantoinase A
MPSADLRYAGQSYTLNLPWQDSTVSSEEFHRRHFLLYGHRLDLPVELVNLRQWVRGPASELRLPQIADGPWARPFGHCELAQCDASVPQFWRRELVAGQVITGPALISEDVATSWVAPGWSLTVDDVGNLRLSRL